MKAKNVIRCLSFLLAVLLLAALALSNNGEGSYTDYNDNDLIAGFDMDSNIMSQDSYRQEIEKRAESDISFLNSNPKMRDAWFAYYGIENHGASLEAFDSGVVTTAGPGSTTFHVSEHPGADVLETGELFLPGGTIISGASVYYEAGILTVAGGSVDMGPTPDIPMKVMGGSAIIGAMTYSSENAMNFYYGADGSVTAEGENVIESLGSQKLYGFSGKVSLYPDGHKRLYENTVLDVYEDNLRTRGFSVSKETLYYGSAGACSSKEPCIEDSEEDILVKPSDSLITMNVYDDQGKAVRGRIFFDSSGISIQKDVMGTGKNIILGYTGSDGLPHQQRIRNDGLCFQCTDCTIIGRIFEYPEIDASRKASENNIMDRKIYSKEYIVLHNPTTSASYYPTERALKRFENPGSGVSTQFVVGHDGTIYQLMDPRRRASAVGGTTTATYPESVTNSNSISIEVAGSAQDEPTPEQVQAVAQLLYYLQQEYNIPTENIVTHDIITRQSPTEVRKGGDGINIYNAVIPVIDPGNSAGSEEGSQVASSGNP